MITCLKTEWEGILTGGNVISTEIVKHCWEFGNYSASAVSLDFFELPSVHDVVIFHWFFFMLILLRVWAVHSDEEFLWWLSKSTLCQMRLDSTLSLSVSGTTLSSSHLTDYQPLNLIMTSLALMLSMRLRKTWPWTVSPAK